MLTNLHVNTNLEEVERIMGKFNDYICHEVLAQNSFRSNKITSSILPDQYYRFVY